LASRPAGRGDPDDRRVDDVRVLVQHCLDLQRRHALAARDDDVLLAVGDAQDALLELAPVAGGEPTVASCSASSWVRWRLLALESRDELDAQSAGGGEVDDASVLG
jgi:hypothetical protein